MRVRTPAGGTAIKASTESCMASLVWVYYAYSSGAHILARPDSRREPFPQLLIFSLRFHSLPSFPT